MKRLLAEFLYSAILWGSLATLLLWWLRRRVTNKWGQRFLFVPFWWLAIHTAIAWYGFVLPPSGRLVDADSGEPIKNTRVIATWLSYPMAIWVSHCSGRQAQLTDADGDFAFRFAPFPTLLFGTTLRGINPQVPGRIDHRELAFVLVPIWGKLPIQKYAPGRMTTHTGPNTECRMDIGPQFVYDGRLLPGEERAFEVLYREACIEQQPATFTVDFMRNLIETRPLRHDPKGLGGIEVIPIDIGQAMTDDLQPRGCSPIGGLCVYPVQPALHARFCAYAATQRVSGGDRK